MSSIVIIFAVVYGITLLCTLPCWAIPYKIRNNIIFGVTLPKEQLEGPFVKECRGFYTRLCFLTVVGQIVLFAPIFFLTGFPGVLTAYFCVYIIIVCVAIMLPPAVANRRLMRIKKANGWLCGPIHEQTKTISAKPVKKPVGAFAFLPVTILSAAALFFSFLSKYPVSGIIVSAAELLSAAFCYFLHRSIVKSPSGGSKAAYWANFAAGVPYLEVISIIPVYLSACGFAAPSTVILLAAAAVSVIATLIWALYAVVKAARQPAADGNSLSDQDDYWIFGMIYSNPKDPSFMVPDRYGLGMTCNMANLKSKIFVFGISGVGLLIVLVVMVLVGILDGTSPTLSISTSNVAIHEPFYGTSFSTSSIREVKLLQTLPDGYKTNGAADSRYWRGHFNLDEYGNSLVYVYLQSKPYIAVNAGGDWILYNEKDASKTLSEYHKLVSLKK